MTNPNTLSRETGYAANGKKKRGGARLSPHIHQKENKKKELGGKDSSIGGKSAR